MSLELQSRDLEILKYAFENRIVTFEQINQKCFPKSTKSIVSRRLIKLLKNGYLSRLSFVSDDTVYRGYGPNEKTYESVKNMWDIDIDLPHYKSESKLHDIRFGNLRFQFEKLKAFVEFLPENILESSSTLKQDYKYRDLTRLHPDARLLLQDRDGRDYVYLIEFELTRKSQDRYNDKLNRYYQAEYLDGVIYICTQNGTQKALAKADELARNRQDSILYLALEKDVLLSQSSLTFKSPNGNEIDFKLYGSTSEHLPVTMPPTSSQVLND